MIHEIQQPDNMFISTYTKHCFIPENIYNQLEELDICFKKELFQFETVSDVIIISMEHEDGDIVCACKILVDYCSYKINKINYKKQLPLIFCLESLRTSIIRENIEMFKSKRTEFRIYWDKNLFKDKIIDQFAKMVDLHPDKKDYYVLDYKNYLTTSGNDIDFINKPEPFNQNGLFKNNPIYNNEHKPLGLSPFSFKPNGMNDIKNDKIFGSPLNGMNDIKNDKVFGSPLNGMNDIKNDKVFGSPLNGMNNNKIEFPKLNFGNIDNEEKDIKIVPPTLFNLGNNNIKKLNI